MTDIGAQYTLMKMHLPRATIFVCLLSAMGCIPLPIPHTARVTPKVVGMLRRSDSSAVTGLSISVSAKYSDVACKYPGVRGVTDAFGRFQLSEGKVRKRIFWLSWMESFGMTEYWLCAHASDTTTAPRRAYVRGNFAGDLVECLDWDWREQERLTCGTVYEGRLVDGGEWSDASGRGWFRVIVADADMRGYKFQGFVQWLQTGALGMPPRVRGTVQLPTNENLSPSGASAAFSTRSGRWYMSVASERPMKNATERRLTFELGVPGQIRAVTSP